MSVLFYIAMLSDIIPSVVLLSVIMLNVVMLSVMAPTVCTVEKNGKK